MNINTKSYDLMLYLSDIVVGMDKTDKVVLTNKDYISMINKKGFKIMGDKDSFYHNMIIENSMDYINYLNDLNLDYIVLNFDSSVMRARDFMDTDYAKRIKDVLKNDYLNGLENYITISDTDKVIISFY